jgi:hypothetical protein
MRYMLLIWENETLSGAMTPAEREADLAAHVELADDLRRQGLLLGGDELLPSESAVTIRVRNGKAVSTDGPFAETREQIGGYYLVECDTLEQARAIAARIPTASTGVIEVRPIRDYDG